MEKKEPIKISLPIFITVIVLLVACISGIYMFMQNQKLDKEIANLKEQMSKTQTEKNELQEKLNNVSNIVNNNNTEKNKETITNIKETFTNEQVQIALSNYLELKAHANCDDLLENLTKKGKLNYNASTDNILDNGKVITSIKFSDYKNAMLNYVSEEEFENNWHSTLYFNENSEGYLTKVQGGGSLAVYTIKNINQKDDKMYEAITSYIVDINDSGPAQDETFDFNVKSYNGHCVIDSINKI